MLNRLLRMPTLIGLLMAVFLWAGWTIYTHKSPFQNNISQFFPNQQNIQSQYLTHQLAKNSDSSWLMLAIPSASNQPPIQKLSHTVQSQLLKVAGVKQVLNGSERFQSPLQDKTAAKLYSYRYLLSDFTPDKIPSHLQKRWQEYQLGLVLDKRWLLEDPTYQWLSYQNAFKPSNQLNKHEGVWLEPKQKRALLLIESDKSPQTLLAINQALTSTLGQKGFDLSGSDWVALQAEKQIKQAVNWITSLAVLMVLLALFVAFRSAKLIFYSSLPLLFAFIVGVLSTISVFGHMQWITLALGAILLGVAIDYPIHTISAYQSKKSTVIARLWPTIRLGALTSVFGFLMLWWTHIEGLQQIAVFASSGLLAALWMTYAIKPYLARFYQLHDVDTQKLAKVEELSQKTTLDVHALSPSRFVLYWLPGLVIIALILFFKPMQWQDDLASLSPVSKSLIATDKQLRADFLYQEAGKKLLLPARDIQALLQKQEALLAELNRLKASGEIKAFTMLASVFPSKATQTKRQQNLPSKSALLAALNQATQATGFKPQHFKPFVNAVLQSKSLTLLSYQQFVESSPSSAQLAQQGVLSLPNQVLGVITLSGVASDQVMEQFAAKQGDSGLIYFNQRGFVAQQIAEIRLRLVQILVFILAVIVLSLAFKYRNIRAVLSILSPIFMAVAATIATLSLLGISLSLFHLMSLLLVVAIGIDYALLFFEGALQKTDTQEWQRSVTVAFFTTLGSFSILSFSSLALLNAMGLTVLIGVLWVYCLSYLMSKTVHVQTRVVKPT